MNYTFVPMNQEYATTIVDSWKYPNEYSIYDYSNEADHMLDVEAWQRGIFAVLDQEGDLVGELSIEFINAQGEFTKYHDFGNQALINGCELWIGFGLRPDLTGQGRGPGFVTACADFAIQHFHYRGEFIRLGVAQFNQRATKTYEKAGFQVFEQAVGEINGENFECLYMLKPL